MSLKKIISVRKAVIAISFESCLSHSVDMLRELQFCAENVNCGILVKYRKVAGDTEAGDSEAGGILSLTIVLGISVEEHWEVVTCSGEAGHLGLIFSFRGGIELDRIKEIHRDSHLVINVDPAGVCSSFGSDAELFNIYLG